jgi:hypothetical protein
MFRGIWLRRGFFPQKTGVLALVVALSIAAMEIGTAGSVYAQSPTPTWFMYDVSPSSGYPLGANAVVVEGLQLGLGGCAYSLSATEQATVYWINKGEQTVTEVTPNAGCDGSITDYENAITDIM